MQGKLRPYAPLLMTFHRVMDAFLGVSVFLFLSWIFRMYTLHYLGFAVLIFFVTMVCFSFMGLYKSWRAESLRYEIRQIMIGCIIVYILLLLVGYTLKVSHEFSRRVVLIWMIAWPVLQALERYGVRSILRRYRKKGYNIRRVVIAGAGELGLRLAEWLSGNAWTGTVVTGFFDDKTVGWAGKYPVLGTLKDITAYSQNNNIDIVYLALPMRAEEKIQWLLKELADSTASVYMVPDIFLFDLLLSGNLMYYDGIPAICIRDTPFRGPNALVKRIEDIVLSSLILIITSPLMLIIAAALKFTSRRPVLFKQWRYGMDGQPFEVYKFRTMNVCEDGYTFTQTTRDDPRVTGFGAFLRKTSLDELPQFFNVIQGRMSIVGPRPHPVSMNEAYRKLIPGYMLRHKVKPGITGLAQIKGFRGETDQIEKMEGRVKHDLEYVRQWSLYLDLKIIILTLWNSAWKTNAY